MKTLLCLLSLVLLSAAASATTIFIGSNAFDTTNDSGHATVDLSGTLHPNPRWAPPLPGSVWISYGATGDHSDPGYFSPPDGTDVIFSTTFMLSGAIMAASLTVLADDTSSVTLNGHTLINADMTSGSTCAKGPIGCVTSTEGIFTLAMLAPYLRDGSNTLSFDVMQVNGSSYGLDFAGSVSTSETPEPATPALIGGGLLALGVLRGRKKAPSGSLREDAR